MLKLYSMALIFSELKEKSVIQFIWPPIIYSLQNAPLTKISIFFLNNANILIRGCVKNVDSCNANERPWAWFCFMRSILTTQ